MEDSDSAQIDAQSVSVASCGSPSEPTQRDASLLFSLQIYVEGVTLNLVSPFVSSSNPLLLAFQLLQYEIVVFDDALACPEASTAQIEPVEMKLCHGKSCLFEANPEELLCELKRDAEAPLTLLLLAKEHGRARLRAFAAVPLSLDIGLLDDDELSGSRLLRICEWASHSGSWELGDHHNVGVGSVTAVVTLSCLGKALAPHLTQALGVQVNKSQPPSLLMEKETTAEPATTENVDENELNENHATASDTAEDKVMKVDKEVEKQDSSVQCDEDMLVEDANESSIVSLNLRNSSNKCGDAGKGKLAKTRTKNPGIGEHILYYRRSSARKDASSPQHIHHRLIRDPNSQRNMRADVINDELLFPRELPPPLFFKKGAKS
ncbi:hypothetical protein F441_13974 [Phytophthora nicotianae CJ01A1]|uniref:Uncharacterized protein n=5 Tax=Phytophthora nicotianae TaxID=4792 RepID=W2PXP6_PHYN3|nr:hypothetical protein PPTG_14748 [Phytophthora nicotianae INRA-310]ETK80706.1 hypothetical protein L915_13689 [Phytophthora nicotianae]ETO69305.1 hypothetical protein F444_14077 [Phytophthora nicotianae P1976]ETP10378.1 hypothetical protein F441_13974 [Phytophthora nicotianae CJ01A1]KUG02200.1 hypothetical protein AM587_10014652 [Phytophthora nicotianae]ETL34128.1 hypothetical protein L916_13589 [Phytophthora nicotianae]